jgi:hypothetical protein
MLTIKPLKNGATTLYGVYSDGLLLQACSTLPNAEDTLLALQLGVTQRMDVPDTAPVRPVVAPNGHGVKKS